MSTYTFGTTILAEFDDAIEKVTAELAAEGFGILSTIDVQATLEAKLGVHRPAYTILGACNPPLANRALDADPEIGALLPCNVVVRTADEGTRISFMDPRAVLGLVGNSDDIEELAREVRAKLRLVRDRLES